MSDLVCVKCGRTESFPLDLPLDKFVCDACMKEKRDEETEALLE